MFDPEQADEWFAYVNHGLKIGYEDREFLLIMATFAKAIRDNQSDVFLSKETEARITKFMRDPRVAF